MLDTRANSDLIYPWPDAGHGFPIGGVETLLDEVEIMSGKASGILRERTDVVERGTDPDDGFFRHGAVYKNLYMLSIVVSLQVEADGSPLELRQRPQLNLSVRPSITD